MGGVRSGRLGALFTALVVVANTCAGADIRPKPTETVWTATKGGHLPTHYHRDGCYLLRGVIKPVALAKAGFALAPCENCFRDAPGTALDPLPEVPAPGARIASTPRSIQAPTSPDPLDKLRSLLVLFGEKPDPDAVQKLGSMLLTVQRTSGVPLIDVVECMRTSYNGRATKLGIPLAAATCAMAMMDVPPASSEPDALQKMSVVFAGGHTRDEIRQTLSTLLILFELPPNDSNYNMLGSMLVGMREKYPTLVEMEVAKTMLLSYGSTYIRPSLAAGAAFCAVLMLPDKR